MDFLPPRKFSSYPVGTAHAELASEIILRFTQMPHFLRTHASPSASGSDHSLVFVSNCHDHETFRLQARNHISNLSFADIEEFRKVSIGSKAPALVVETVNLDKENFFHERQTTREPNLPWNPDTLEIALRYFHRFHSTLLQPIQEMPVCGYVTLRVMIE